MRGYRRRQAASPSANSRKEQSYSKRRNQAPFALVEMRERKQQSRSQNTNEQGARPVLKHILGKAAVYEFLADRYRSDQCGEGEALDAVAGKYLEGQLDRSGVKCAWIGFDSASTSDLI